MQKEPVATLEGHEDRVWCVNWNPGGTLLVSSGSDRIIRIWKRSMNSDEENEWRCSSKLEDAAHRRTVRSVAFSPCQRYLASASFDASAVVWELKDGDYEQLATLEGHENELKCIAWSKSGRYLATCSRDKSVWIWEMDEDDEFQVCSILQSHSQDVKCVSWHPRMDMLASCSYDNSIRFYAFDGEDFVTSQIIEAAHESTVWSVAFNAQGTLLATCSDDQTVKIWKQTTVNGEPIEKAKWAQLCTLKANDGVQFGAFYSIDWCPVTDLLAVGCGDNSIRVYRLIDPSVLDPTSIDYCPSLELIESIDNAHSQDVNSVRWNPKSSGLLASCSDDGSIKLWQIDGWN